MSEAEKARQELRDLRARRDSMTLHEYLTALVTLGHRLDAALVAER